MAASSIPIPPNDLYETDFLAWTELMAAALEKRDTRSLDWNHLAEEIRDLGINQKSARGHGVLALVC